jgi:hypothetical protein
VGERFTSRKIAYSVILKKPAYLLEEYHLSLRQECLECFLYEK